MRKNIYILLILAAWCISNNPARAREAITARLEPTRAFYLLGEPIELRLTVINEFSESVNLIVAYPTFAWNEQAGIRFSSPARPSQIRFRRSMARVAERLAQAIPLEPGDSWSTKIYLQRFVPDVQAGTMRLPYSIDIPYESRKGETRSGATANGILQIVVLNGSGNEVADSIAEYGRHLESPDVWTRRTAAEALSAATSPAAIPYLQKLVRGGEADLALQGLGRFRGNADAEALVREVIGLGRQSGIVQGLAILSDWHYPLPADEFARLLQLPDAYSRLAALRYAKDVHGVAYLSAISACAADESDPSVLKEIQDVRRALGASGQ